MIDLLFNFCKDKKNEIKLFFERMCAMSDTRTFKVPVDYDNAELGRFDAVGFLNRNPHIGQEHFSRSCVSGKVLYTLGYVELENGGTTEEVLTLIDKEANARPDLVTTLEFHRLFPEEQKTATIVSFCGKVMRLQNVPFIVYINADASGLSAFLNWMTFRRSAKVKYLRVIDWEIWNPVDPAKLNMEM